MEDVPQPFFSRSLCHIRRNGTEPLLGDTSGERRGSNQNKGNQRGLIRAIAPGLAGGNRILSHNRLPGGVVAVHDQADLLSHDVRLLCSNLNPESDYAGRCRTIDNDSLLYTLWHTYLFHSHDAETGRTL